MVDLFSDKVFSEDPLEDPLSADPLFEEEEQPPAPSLVKPVGPTPLNGGRAQVDEQTDQLLESSLDELEKQRNETLLTNLETPEDPDRLGRVERLSRSSGLPLEVVEQDPDQVQRLQVHKNTLPKLKHAPALKRRLTEDPAFAGIAQDDVDALAFWETRFRDISPRGPEPTFLERTQAAGASILSGFIRVPKTVLDLMDLTGNFFGGVDFRESTTGKAITNLQENFFQKSLDILQNQFTPLSVRRRVTENTDLIPNLDQFLRTGFELVPQLPGMFLVGSNAQKIARMLGASERVAAFTAGAGASLPFATSEVYSQTVQEAREIFEASKNPDGSARWTPEQVESLSQRAAFYAVSLNAVPTAVLGGIGLAPAFRSEGGLLRRAVVGGLADVLPEGGQELWEEVSSILGIDLAGEFERDLLAPENIPRFSQSFILGGMLGFGTGSTIAALGGIEADAIKASRADLNEQVFRAIGEKADESKLAERVPDAYMEFVKEATEEGPVEDVYISARGFQEYFQSQGLPAEEFAATIPGAREQLEDALAAGEGDIKIPIEEFAVKVARSEHLEGLMKHSKFDPLDFSMAEAEEFRKDEARRFQEQAEQTLRESEIEEAVRQSSDRVRESIKQKLTQTGRFSPDVAEQYATLYQAKAEISARHLGIQPHEVFEKFGIVVRSNLEDVPDLQTLNQSQLESEIDRISQTSEFQEFFQDSVVIDENGRPRVLFHATSGPEFEAFDPNLGDFGSHFGTFDQANVFTPKEIGDVVPGRAPRVLPVFLSIQNPLRLEDRGNFSLENVVPQLKEKGFDFPDLDIASPEEIRQALQEAGFDGIVYLNRREIKSTDEEGKDLFAGGEFVDPTLQEATDEEFLERIPEARDSFIAFEPEQVKSIFNQGAFKRDTGNVLFQTEPPERFFNPGWYFSFLQEAIETLPAKKALPKSGKEWLTIIKKISGVKKEEIEWTGLSDWLNIQEGNVTQEGISQFLSLNGVGVLDVSTELVQQKESMVGTIEDLEDEFFSEIIFNHLDDEIERVSEERMPEELAARVDVRREEILVNNDPPDLTEQEADDLARSEIDEGNVFRELMDSLTVREMARERLNMRQEFHDAARAQAEAEYVERDRALQAAPVSVPINKYEKYTLPGGAGYRELLLKMSHPKRAVMWNKMVEIHSKIWNFANQEKLPEGVGPTETGFVPEPTQQEREFYRKHLEAWNRGDFDSHNREPFKHAHWEDQENILSFVRFKERNTFDEATIQELEAVEAKLDQDIKPLTDEIQRIREILRGQDEERQELVNAFIAEDEKISKARHRAGGKMDDRIKAIILEEAAEKGETAEFLGPNLVGNRMFRRLEQLIQENIAAGRERDLLNHPLFADLKAEFEQIQAVGQKRIQELVDKRRELTDAIGKLEPGRDKLLRQRKEITKRAILKKEEIEKQAKPVRVLFLEEMQSDWAQAHRKATDKIKQFQMIGPLLDLQRPRTVEGAQRFEESVRSDERLPPPAPFIKKTEDWTALTLKRMIPFALENGFERIEWTTGLQQSERYNLSDEIQAVSWNEDTGVLKVQRVGDPNFRQMADNVKREELADFVGKNAARDLLTGSKRGAEYRMASADLKISAKGMGGYYDNILPKVAGKVMKALTGQKVTIKKGDPQRHNYTPGEQAGFDLAPFRESLQKQSGEIERISLFQKKKGSFQFDPDITQSPSVINLLEGADLSTFLHESGHFFFEMDRQMALHPDAPAELKQGVETLIQFAGVKDAATWNNMTPEQRRDGHEKIARAFELYLFEGNAPSLELRDIFRRFRAWLVQVYRTLRGLNVNLTDDVRQVFDRMLATEDQLNAIRKERAYEPLFKNAVEAGMTEDEWESYRRTVAQDEEEAQEDLTQRSLRNMRWLGKARGKVLRRLQRESRARRRQVERDVTEEVATEPIYAARAFIRGPVAKKPKPKFTPNVDNQNDSLFQAIAKLGGLNRQEVADQWGITDPIRSGVFGKPLLRAGDKGIPIDQMAQALAVEGYVLVDENDKAEIGDFEDRFMDELSGIKRFSRFNENFNITEELEAFYEENLHFIDLSQVPHAKMDRQALEEMYGNEEDAIWKQFPDEGRYAMVADDGLHPDVIAETFGFKSGDDLVRQLAAAPPMSERVAEVADQRMLELFGDLNTPEQIEQAADEAVHNEARTRMVHAELTSFSKRVGQGNIITKAARDWARDRIGNMLVRDIKPTQYIAAETRAKKKAAQAFRRGNLEEATEFKRAEVLNHHFAKEAVRAKGKIENALTFFRKFDRKGTRKSIDPEHLEQIDRLLEKYDLRKSTTKKEIERRKSFARWLEEQRNDGLEPVVDTRLVEDSELKSFQDMFVDELQALRDTVASIEHTGRLKSKLLTARAQRELEKAAQRIANTVGINAKRAPKKPLEPRLSPEERRRGIHSFFASHRKISNLVRVMDGLEDAGPIWELLVRPLNMASDWETTELANATERLGDLFGLYSGRERANLENSEFIPALNSSMSKMGRLVVALNWGNITNRARLMNGNKLSDVEVQAILDTLDKRDWDFVQGVWDLIDEYWPLIKEKQERVTGIAPEKVEATPVETPFGLYRGGYYPVQFESLLDQKAYADEIADMEKNTIQGNYVRATTRRGHTKERLETLKVARPIRLDFGVLFGHLERVIHDLAFHEYLVDANRLLKHEKVQAAIIEMYGVEDYRAIVDTLKDVAVGPIPAANGVERAINWVRQGVTIANLGWNFGTAVLQPFGLAQSMVRIGPKYVMRGMRRWLSGAVRMEGTLAWIQDVSPFMKNRGRTLNREISEIRNQISERAARRKLLGRAEDSYFEVIRIAQLAADVPTWLGQYEKSMDQGQDEETAILQADQAVIDSQGGGHIKDLAKIQRGGPFMRLWTNFYSYFNVTYNLLADRISQTQPLKHPLSIGRLGVDIFALITVPVVLETLVRDALLRGECDHGRDMECVTKKLLRGQVAYSTGMLLGVREVSSPIQGFHGYSGPAGTRFFAELAGLIQQVEQGEADAAAIKKLNKTLGIFFHYPASQLERTVEGFMALQRGDTKNPAAPVFGVSRR